MIGELVSQNSPLYRELPVGYPDNRGGLTGYVTSKVARYIVPIREMKLSTMAQLPVIAALRVQDDPTGVVDRLVQ